jgi:hypothetical protein
MTQVSAERGSKELPKLSRFASGLTVAKLVLRNPGVLKKLMVLGPDEPRYVRPPRQYVLPAYREGMKRCTSNEKYLRPTRWCNPREPLVVAMAHELGAYELSDWEFAEAAYWFVKTKFAGEIVPLDSVSATLRRGTGTCMHLNSLWIALCRAAGIKARYKRFQALLQNVVMDLDVTKLVDLDETEQAMVPELVTAFQAFDPAGAHAEGEACIDGEWVVADVGMDPETQAYAGIPITKFGEDSIDATGWKPIPGTIERVESLPLAVGITMRLQSLLIPTVMERANVIFSEMVPLGRKIIEEAGGIEAYDRSVRRKRELFATEEIAEAITRLTKDAEHRQVVEFEK